MIEKPSLDRAQLPFYLHNKDHLDHYIQAILDNRNDDLINLLKGHRLSEQDISYALVIGACVSGRKDLFSLLDFHLGYIPHITRIKDLLDSLQMRDTQSWLCKNYLILLDTN